MRPHERTGRIPPGLLVSVRSVSEAVEAVEGGAAIVDVKEPERGPLGRSDPELAAAIGLAVGGRAAWTLACGELADGAAAIAAHVDRVMRLADASVAPPLAIKAGPAGLDEREWRRKHGELVDRLPASVDVVAVGYADWRPAGCLEPGRLIEAAIEVGARAVLIDTFDKSAPGLLGTVGPQAITAWISALDAAGVRLALAGRLTAAEVACLGGRGSLTLGVRSAACEGGRMGHVDRQKVASLVGTLAGARGIPRRPPEAVRP